MFIGLTDNEFINELQRIQNKKTYHELTKSDVDSSNWLLVGGIIEIFLSTYKHPNNSYDDIFELHILRTRNPSFPIIQLHKNKIKFLSLEKMLVLDYILSEEQYFMQSTIDDLSSVKFGVDVFIELYNLRKSLIDIINDIRNNDV